MPQPSKDGMAGAPAILLLRLKGPLMGWGGVRIDAYGDSAPIPLTSMVAGLLSAALGVQRRNRYFTQRMQDAMDIGVAVLRRGRVLTEYQTTDLGKPHMTGPMWTVEGKAVNRAGSSTDGTRQVFKPYIADADVLVAVRLGASFPFSCDAVEAALAEPDHPLFLGRASCPPSLPLFIGWHSDGSAKLAAALTAACQNLGVAAEEIWLPTTLAEPAPGDMLVTIPTRRDWMQDRHVGSETYLRRLP